MYMIRTVRVPRVCCVPSFAFDVLSVGRLEEDGFVPDLHARTLTLPGGAVVDVVAIDALYFVDFSDAPRDGDATLPRAAALPALGKKRKTHLIRSVASSSRP